MNADRKVGLLIPMFRSASTIGSVLHQIAGTVKSQNIAVLILDNNSDDESCERAIGAIKSLQLSEFTEIQRHKRNLGYGGSIIWGLKWARDRSLQRIAIIHSDDQADWQVVLDGLLSEDEISNVILLASRFSKDASVESYDMRRRLGNQLFLLLTPLLTGVRLDDPGTGICSLPVSKIPYDVLDKLDSGYHFHPQLNLILASDANSEVKYIPLSWRDASRDNHFPLIRYGLMLVTMLLRISFLTRIRRWDIKRAVVHV